MDAARKLSPDLNTLAYGCPRTPLNLSAEENTTVVKELRIPSHSVPHWREDVLHLWLRGLPLDIPSTSPVGIYRLS